MTQDDMAIYDRLKHESLVRWVRSSGRSGWQACDVRSEVMLDAAKHIRSMAERIDEFKKALEMHHVVQHDLRVALDETKKQAAELEKLRAELRTYTDGTNDEVQREAL